MNFNVIFCPLFPLLKLAYSGKYSSNCSFQKMRNKLNNADQVSVRRVFAFKRIMQISRMFTKKAFHTCMCSKQNIGQIN